MPTGVYPHINRPKHSEETKRKIGLANSISLLGKKGSEESKKKRSETMKKIGNKPPVNFGKDNVNWKNGITPLNSCIRHCFNYRQWISDVFTRDNYTCQSCNVRGGELHAHHIKPFSLILKENNIKTLKDALLCSELWNINNGQTLCILCHKETDTYGLKLLMSPYINNLNN